MDNVNNDPLIMEAIRIILHWLFYMKDTEYHSTTVVNFYVHLEKAKYSTQMKIAYMINGKKKVFNISPNMISCICGMPFGNDSEQTHKGNRPLGDWCL